MLGVFYSRAECYFYPAPGECLGLLVDPVELAVLVGDNLLLLEPEGNLLLGALDAVGAVADIAANILQFRQHRHGTQRRGLHTIA